MATTTKTLTVKTRKATGTGAAGTRFDAVELSWRLREDTGRELAALSREERLARLNAHLRPLPRREEPAGDAGAA